VITLAAVAAMWNGFFHAQEPPHTLALFRILFGALLLINTLLLARDARVWLGPDGVLGHHEFRRVYGHSRFTLLRYLPPTQASVTAMLVAHLVAATALMVGWHTPWSAAAVYVTLTSLQHRNPLICYGADDVMRIMALLLIVSGAGDVASVDRWLADRSGQAPPERTVWATRLMQMEVSIIYLQAFLAKFSGESWRTGTAVYYAVQVPKYQRFRLPRFASTLGWSRLMTWSTIAIEGALGPLIWIREFRPAVLTAGIGLHVAMEAFMNLHLFGPTMIICLLLFLDPGQAEQILRALRIV